MLLSGMSFTAELAKRAFLTAIFQVAEPLTFLALCGGGCRVNFLYPDTYAGNIKPVSDSFICFFFRSKSNRY
jgi:hypothetical protein